ncbi:Spb1 C-terminal domain-containing protein [Entophlyctis helioformis]|nr:Spb1 C-terminal domain-containing protein [Entophlyctis helioformis]
MGQKVQKKNAKGRLDKYYHMAKEQGYRARSAFKLIQLNKKYNFLERSKVVVDLCAAPGGWLQVAAKYMPKPNIIIGLDLDAIKPIPGVITHVEDITTAKCRATLKAELKTWKADVFLHDGAPNVGTSWLQDAFTQAELTLSALKLATEFLVPGGTFVTKVFRSKDYQNLIWVFQQLFRKVEATKPASSRNVSAEIFVVCRDYIAPKKIDPKLLDPKYAFKEIDDNEGLDQMDEKKVKEKQGALLNELFGAQKRRRFRDGYEDNDYTLHKTNTVTAFVNQSDYVSILANSHELKFDLEDEQSKTINDSPLTNSDIREYIQDLKVLGKKEFKELIKWRESMRQLLGLETAASRRAKKAEDLATAEAAAKEAEENEDLDAMLERERAAQELRDRRAKKKQRERKAKLLLKLQLGMKTPDDIGLEAHSGLDALPDMVVGDDMDTADFNDPKARKAAKAKRDAAETLTPASVVGEADDASASDDDEDDDEDMEDGDSDSDTERARKVGRLESEIDALYAEYETRRTERNPTAKAKKNRDVKTQFEEWYGVEYEKKLGKAGTAAAGPDGMDGAGSADESSDFSDSEDSETDVPAKRGKKADAASRKRRSTVDFEDEEEAEAEAPRQARLQPRDPSPKGKTASLFASEMQLSDDSDDENEQENAGGKKTKKGAKKGAKKSKDAMMSAFADDDDADGIPAVPVDADSDDDAPADGDFVIDTAAKYTLAQQMSTRSGKRDLIDNAYNRYAFSDPEGLPSWFQEDEGRHNKPTPPVTKEAADIMRQRMRALDARPIKKVAEAKFRKQMRAQRRVEKMARKAENLNNDEDMSEKTKLEAISKMMGKAKNKKEFEKPKLVVAKGMNKANKGRPKGVKGRYKMVDPRMLKDMRAAKANAKRSKGKGRGRK